MLSRITGITPGRDLSPLSMENPVFVAYAIAAALMILKFMAQGWVTMLAMTRSNAGLLNPEDLLITILY